MTPLRVGLPFWQLDVPGLTREDAVRLARVWMELFPDPFGRSADPEDCLIDPDERFTNHGDAARVAYEKRVARAAFETRTLSDRDKNMAKGTSKSQPGPSKRQDPEAAQRTVPRPLHSDYWAVALPRLTGDQATRLCQELLTWAPHYKPQALNPRYWDTNYDMPDEIKRSARQLSAALLSRELSPEDVRRASEDLALYSRWLLTRSRGASRRQRKAHSPAEEAEPEPRSQEAVPCAHCHGDEVPSDEQPLWTLDIPGLTRPDAKLLTHIARRMKWDMGDMTIDPAVWFTSHADRPRAAYEIRVAKCALASGSLRRRDRIDISDHLEFDGDRIPPGISPEPITAQLHGDYWAVSILNLSPEDAALLCRALLTWAPHYEPRILDPHFWNTAYFPRGGIKFSRRVLKVALASGQLSDEDTAQAIEDLASYTAWLKRTKRRRGAKRR